MTTPEPQSIVINTEPLGFSLSKSKAQQSAFEKALESCNMSLLDIKEVGCLVLRVSLLDKLENESEEEFEFRVSMHTAALDGIREHIETYLNCKVLFLPDSINIECIPRGVLGPPEIYNVVEELINKVLELEDRLNAKEI